MNKTLLLLVLFFVTSFSYSQEKEFNGRIANEKDIGGIHIQNQTSRHNSVTHADGTFRIMAKVNDTLLVTSITYKQQQVVVSATAYNKAELVIVLEAVVNELDEVKVGSLLSKEERDQLEKVEGDLKDAMSWDKMEFDYEFTQDKYSSIVGNKAHDAYFNGQKQNDGVKLHLIIPAVIKFLRKKDTEVRPQLPKDLVRFYLKEKFTKEDLLVYFKIEPESAEDFLYFLVEQGVPDDFLDPNNEMELTQLINDKALLYNTRAKE